MARTTLLVLAVSVVLATLGTRVDGSLSGLYASNGLDQTVIQRLATPQEKRFVEREILSLLGLPRRPRAAPGRAAAAAALRREQSLQGLGDYVDASAAAAPAQSPPSLAASKETASAAGPAPRFLLGVYEALLRQQQLQQLAGEDGAGGGSAAAAAAAMEEAEEAARAMGFDLSGYDRAVLDKSDVIMGFVSRPGRAWSGTAAARPRHARGRRLWFDAAEAPPADSLLGAELRLFQRGRPHRPPHPPPADHSPPPPLLHGEEREDDSEGVGHNDDEQFVVTLYQLLPVPGQGEALLRVDEANTTARRVGWLLLNATAPLAAWASAPAANLGLHLAVRRSRDGHEIHPSDIGLVAEGEGDDEERQPFMVGFFKSPPATPRVSSAPLPVLQRSSRKRNPFLPEEEDDEPEQLIDDWVEEEEEAEDEEEESNDDIDDNKESEHVHLRTARDTSSRKRRKSASTPSEMQGSQWASRSCQMLELYVNFKDLHWQDWIIAPAGFQAFYCSGECNFPLNAHMNATNHAIVQTLVHLMNPLQVPKPCCAPTKLGPIQILYYLEDSNVTLKRYKNMVVKSCGCH